jgi:hypothetical protein
MILSITKQRHDDTSTKRTWTGEMGGSKTESNGRAMEGGDETLTYISSAILGVLAHATFLAPRLGEVCAKRRLHFLCSLKLGRAGARRPYRAFAPDHQ